MRAAAMAPMARCNHRASFPSSLVPAFAILILPVAAPPRARFPKRAGLRRRHPTALASHRVRCALLVASSTEEEQFIRRQAQAAVTVAPSSADIRKDNEGEQEEAEEQFDFVREADPSTSQTNQKSGDKSSSTAPERSAVPTPSPVPHALRHTEEGSRPAVRVVVPSALRSASQRVQREGAKLFTESLVGTNLRMPTRREAFLFAWELGLVVGLLLLLRAGVSRTLKWIHNRLSATRGLQSNIPYEASVFECMQRPLEFLSLFTVGTALVEAVSRPLAAMGLLRHIRTLRELGIIISAAWFLLRWIDRIRARFAVDKRVDKSQVDATSRIATVVTFVASLLISLDTIGINVQTVLAFGGIGGVAIGFAGKEIISNFFGGFMIYVTRPFAVGEWIRSIEEAELNGTVEDIGWYLTRVRTWDKRPLYIPNSRFSTLIVENGSRMDNRRILHTLQLRHEDMPVVPTIVAAMESLLLGHPELDPRQHRLAYVDSFGEYSVKLWLSCYTKSVFLYDFRRVQQDILIKCYDIIRANGARLANVNTRDVRPGADTDRYGPFGSSASFGQGVPELTVPDNTSRVPYVNSDVPRTPQYGVDSPLVRFNTIESGVDFSRTGQTSASSTASTAANGNRNARNGSAADGTRSQESLSPQSDRSASSQRTTSAAAVAAATAALAAARRNAARIEDGERSNGSPAARRQTDGKDPSNTGSEATGSSPAPSGQMKIKAAKTGRVGSQGSSSQNSTTQGNSNQTKHTESGLSSDATRSGSPSKTGVPEDDPLRVAKAGGSGQAGSARSGVMKINAGRKPGGSGQIGTDSGSMVDGDKPKRYEVYPSRSESAEEARLSGDSKLGSRTGSGQGKAGAAEAGSRNAAELNQDLNASTTTSSTGTSADNEEKSGEESEIAGNLASKKGLKDDVFVSQGATANFLYPPSAPATMKISKARKPMSLGKNTVDGEDSRNVANKKAAHPAVPPNKAKTSKPAPSDDSQSES